MGTPHMGSDLVKWGSMARKLLSFFPGVRLDSTMLSMLGQNSETLQNINTLFTGIASSFEIVYFYEELETLLPTGQHEIIVPYSSAIVDSPNTEKIGIHGTHHTMVKYRDEFSPGYSDVAGILRQMVDNAITFAPGRWEAERRSAVAATNDKIREILVQRGMLSPLACRHLNIIIVILNRGIEYRSIWNVYWVYISEICYDGKPTSTIWSNREFDAD
ncbi:hypothetical protein ABW21_db0205476 [Orbilia brochopaga]|nr:hypothetical protein ABW21_db0205476 [Drechslerella brochopaga]